jgi:xylose isomerase
MSYFSNIPKIAFEGAGSDNPLAFHHYDANKQVLGKSMAEHLRLAVATGTPSSGRARDVFGAGTFDRPVAHGRRSDGARRAKADAAFDFFSRLGTPFYTFHDTDVSPEGANLTEYANNFAAMVDVLEAKQAQTGMKLLWGTANVFSHPRYAAGAATNPQPEVFAYAATQVFHAMERDASPRRRELRAVGRPRRLRDAAQHRSEARA